MRLGIAIDEADPWGFFNEIYQDLSQHHQTSIFKERAVNLPVFHSRVNRMVLHRDLQGFMEANNLVFFEWAGRLLLTATTQLKKTCSIVTRLHRYEMYQWAERINWEPVDRVILVSKAMQQEFIKRFPDHAYKTVVASPSTSLEKFIFKPKPFNGDIGILCHLTPRKRVYDLILTFSELLQKRQDLHLHVGGGCHPAYQDYYEALHYVVQELKLQDYITFYGNVSETWDWYHKIDIFVSNSYSEGLQVSPMEAMASGCYCLSHRWNGAEELLPQDNLFFTDRELLEKILGYCDIPETEKQAQKEQMRAIACEKFDIRQTIAQIRAVIEKVNVASTFNNNGHKS